MQWHQLGHMHNVLIQRFQKSYYFLIFIVLFIFGGTQISLEHSVGQMVGSLHAKTQLDPSSRFDTIPACDGQTDTHTHKTTAYTVLAWPKNVLKRKHTVLPPTRRYVIPPPPPPPTT